MNQLTFNIDSFITGIIDRYNGSTNTDHTESIKQELAYTFLGIFGTDKEQIVEALLQSIQTLTLNDLDVGDAYYTKTDGEPTLKKFMINESRLRQANENRGRMKNAIDSLLSELAGTPKGAHHSIRITNLNSFSAYLDRLCTERIKEYTFRHKQYKLQEAEHQVFLVKAIIQEIKKLFIEIFKQEGYSFIGEKRTFDEHKLIYDISQVVKNISTDS